MIKHNKVSIDEISSINSAFIRALKDKKYRSELANSFELEDIFQKANSTIDEKTFLEVITKSKFNKKMRNIIFDAKHYVISLILILLMK